MNLYRGIPILVASSPPLLRTVGVVATQQSVVTSHLSLSTSPWLRMRSHLETFLHLRVTLSTARWRPIFINKKTFYIVSFKECSPSFGLGGRLKFGGIVPISHHNGEFLSEFRPRFLLVDKRNTISIVYVMNLDKIPIHKTMNFRIKFAIFEHYLCCALQDSEYSSESSLFYGEELATQCGPLCQKSRNLGFSLYFPPILLATIFNQLRVYVAEVRIV